MKRPLPAQPPSAQPSTAQPSTGRRLLIVSNGGAEDLIGAALGRELLRLAARRASSLELLALPLVGAGAAYGEVARLAGPTLDLPSGGFPFASLSNLNADLGAGLIGTSLSQGGGGLAGGASGRAGGGGR